MREEHTHPDFADNGEVFAAVKISGGIYRITMTEAGFEVLCLRSKKLQIFSGTEGYAIAGVTLRANNKNPID